MDGGGNGHLTLDGLFDTVVSGESVDSVSVAQEKSE